MLIHSGEECSSPAVAESRGLNLIHGLPKITCSSRAIADRYQRIPSISTVVTGDIEIEKDLDSTLLYWYLLTSESDPRENISLSSISDRYSRGATSLMD